MNNSFIQEAFRDALLTEDVEELALDAMNPDDTQSFLDVINDTEDDEMLSDVYDLEAEAKEDLKQSYIGKVILDCNVCHSNVFFNKEEITQDEDGICCTEIECPYCMSNEGYTIIGEVKPYQEEEDVDIEDIETEEVPEEDEVDIDIEDEDTEDEEELEEGLKADEVKELRGNEEINGADGPIAAVDELEGSDEIRGPKYSELNEGWMPINKISRYRNVADEYQVNERFKVRNAKTGKDLEYSTNKGGYNDLKVTVKTKDGKNTSVAKEVLEDEIDILRSENLGKSPFTIKEGCEKEDLDECGNPEIIEEAIEDVQVSTEDETMTMTTKEDGGVVIETSPKEDEFIEEEPSEEWAGEEMIAPLEPETETDVEDAIEVNTAEDEEEIPEDEFADIDMEDIPEEGEDFEEFDEESFNGLGESYLKRCYENVTSFKTSNITLNENKEFIIEGKIGFDSGNQKNTQFVFTPKSNKNGRLKLEGYNKQISRGKKTFKLNCSVNNKSLVCESLNYNYKGKNDLNESVRVYGTVKRK